LGLKTEASSRFERGGDIDAPPIGIARAAALLIEMGAGEPRGATIDRYPAPRTRLQIELRASRIARILGAPVPNAEIPRLLTPLGFVVSAAAAAPDESWN